MISRNAPQQHTKRQRLHYRYWALAVLLIILLLTAGVRIRLLDVPLERDEGAYAYMAQLILQGIPPYAESHDVKMPGLYAAYALLLALFGQTQRGIHFGLLLVNAGTIVLLFLLAKKLLGNLAAVVTAAAFAILSLSQPVQRDALLKEAYVVIHLNLIPERFGLVMAESMAAGVPVIAMDLGSCREVIADKITGYLVNSVDEAVQAVGKIDRIDRKKCRQRVEEHFTIDCMVSGYEKIYEEIFRKGGSKKAGTEITNNEGKT